MEKSDLTNTSNQSDQELQDLNGGSNGNKNTQFYIKSI